MNVPTFSLTRREGFRPLPSTGADLNSIPNPFATVPGVIKQIALDAISVVVYEPKVPAEPRLMPYVCERGAGGYC